MVWTLRRGPTVGLDTSKGPTIGVGTSEGPHNWSGHFGGAPQLVWTLRRAPQLVWTLPKKNLSRCRYRKNKSFSLGSILGRDKIILSPTEMQYSGRCSKQHTKGCAVSPCYSVTVLQCLSAVAVLVVTTQTCQSVSQSVNMFTNGTANCFCGLARQDSHVAALPYRSCRTSPVSSSRSHFRYSHLQFLTVKCSYT